MKRILIILGMIALISCQSTQNKEEESTGVTFPPEAVEISDSKNIDNPKYYEIGYASWYGVQFQGKPTASGEIFDRSKLTAAHRTIPFGSVVKVQNLENNKEADVTINDRGPYDEGNIIEVTEKAAELLSFKEESFAKVGINIISPSPDNLILVKDDSFIIDEDDDDDDDDDLDEETAPIIKNENKKPPVYTPPPAAEKKAPAPSTNKTTPSSSSKSNSTPETVPTISNVSSGSHPKGETVQVGVFREQRRAEAYRDHIKKDFSEKIFLFNREGMYVVQIGDFAKRDDAVSLRERLKSKKILNCFIPRKN